MVKGYLGNICFGNCLLKNHIVHINEVGEIIDITPFKYECEGIILCDNLIVIIKETVCNIEEASKKLQKIFDISISYDDFINSAEYKEFATSSTDNASIIEIEIKEGKIYSSDKIENSKQNIITNSKSYKLVCTLATLMDKYYIDPIIGFIPIAGDIIPPLCSIPSIYVSSLKLKSIPLTLTVVLNILIDTLAGMIPFFIGNIIDFYNKAYIKNLRLIIGYVNDDKDTINKVNKKAMVSLILIFTITLLLIVAIVYISKLTAFVWEYFKELFG